MTTLVASLIVTFGASAVTVSSSSAAIPQPAWSIQSVAGPTNFIPGDESGTETYRLYITNLGSQATDGTPVTITDTLPPGVAVSSAAIGVLGVNYKALESEPVCTETPVQCTYGGGVPPGDILEMDVPVAITPSTSRSVTNVVNVSGGGATGSSKSTMNEINTTPAPFAINDFGFNVTGLDGAPETQAGAHPYAVTTTLDFNTGQTIPPTPGVYTPAQSVKDVIVDLPLGFVGDALAAPQCPLDKLEEEGFGKFQCPANTKIGEVTLRSVAGTSTESSLLGAESQVPVSPLFNLVPEHGHPAEFGFKVGEVAAVHLYASVVHTSEGYVLRVTTPDSPAQLYIGTQGFLAGITLTLFGDPGRQVGGNPPVPFFTNPVDCSANGLAATVHLDTWTQQGRVNPDGTPDFSDPNWLTATSPLPSVTGCSALEFDPAIGLKPDTVQADSPTSVTVEVKMPQSPSDDAALATPMLKKAVVSLPAGLSVSPSSANGLEACSLAQIGLDDTHEPTCPDGSKIGTIELETPLLAKPLGGSIYLARQSENPFGSLIALYLVIDDPATGVVIKLPGAVSLDPATGRITSTFDQTPQLPFSELRVRFKTGARAPLIAPQACGTYTTTSSLTPWSAPGSGPPATPSDSFAITSGCSAGFSPSFLAGTTNNQAGAFSPFTLSFSRQDSEEGLGGLTVSLPPGLAARFAGVAECTDAQLAAAAASSGAAEQASPSCPSSSLLGTVTTAVGPGPNPFVVGGKAYLTGPYKGAPFGIAVVVPALAGPFDLGTVVIRQALYVDPHDVHGTDVSDPFPTILQGIPLHIKRVNVTLDRPGFTFNPTSCEPKAVNATFTSTGGRSTPASSRFQAAGCGELPFHPQFTVSTSGKASKANGASLTVKVTQKPGEANIHKVDLQLPLILPARLTTLQKACTEAQFGANPAGCPAASVIGTATAVTPVLSVPLTGPAYLVSHGGAAFPDVEFVLQGQGVTVVLDGGTDIKKGITYSRFEAVPDAPISSFETILPEGPHSALAANGDLCSQTRVVTVHKRVVRRVHGRARHVTRSVRQVTAPSLSMPTTIVGQNGAQIRQATKIAVTGCARHKRAKKAARHKTRRKRKK
jgi:hypothetical protein